MSISSQQTTFGRGRVISRTKGFYYLVTDQNERVECKVKGQLFQNSRFDNQIAVGDIVRFTFRESDKVGLIDRIETRKSFLVRSRVMKEADQIIAANMDYLLIIAAAKHPAFRFNFVNRILVAAAVGNVTPILVITKTDLVTHAMLRELVEPYQKTGLEIVFSSIKESTRNPRLKSILSNHICLLSGQSGVGKSTLINTYFPDLSLKVGDISQKTSKGSHTTTHAKMFQTTDSGFVIDTPGIREFGMRRVDRSNLGQYYPAIDQFSQVCKHRDCVHVHEPGCAVKEAVKNGEIHPMLYDGYVSIYNSL